MDNKLNRIIAVAEKFALDAMGVIPTHPDSKNTPTKGGVYVIYHNSDGIIYVGKARNLKRRVHSDHISGELKNTTSTFRRSVNSKYGIPFGDQMRKWIDDNCRFGILEVDDADIRGVVESILIATLRSDKLLNKP